MSQSINYKKILKTANNHKLEQIFENHTSEFLKATW